MFDDRTPDRIITNESIANEVINKNIALTQYGSYDLYSKKGITKQELITNFQINQSNATLSPKSSNQLVAKRDIASLVPNAYFYSACFQIIALSDSSTMAVGEGSGYTNIIKFFEDGTPNVFGANFVNPSASDTSIRSFFIQPDGKIVAVGVFQYYGGIARSNIVRINTDGTNDSSFSSATFPSVVYSIALQSDGKMIAVGGVNTDYIVRINASGTIDSSFSVGVGFNFPPKYVTIQPDGKVIVVGRFTEYNGYSCSGIVRLNTNGSIDTSFQGNVGSGFNVLATSQHGVLSALVQSDGKIVVVGKFDSYNGTTARSLIRLNSNGTPDYTFIGNISSAFNGSASTDYPDYAIQQSDGKLVIVGGFVTYNSVTTNNIIRLNTDGTTDTSFQIGSGFGTGRAYTIAQQPDGKLVVGGVYLNKYNGYTIANIARLFPNGRIDLSF